VAGWRIPKAALVTMITTVVWGILNHSEKYAIGAIRKGQILTKALELLRNAYIS
jgi:hypothetical protein